MRLGIMEYAAGRCVCRITLIEEDQFKSERVANHHVIFIAFFR
jgi:hypothetical protein